MRTLLLSLLLSGCAAQAAQQPASQPQSLTLAMGARCIENRDCASGICSTGRNSQYYGWCTGVCTTNTECGPGNVCRKGNGRDVCIPSCVDDTACDVYESGSTCSVQVTADGSLSGMCSYPWTAQ